MTGWVPILLGAAAGAVLAAPAGEGELRLRTVAPGQAVGLSPLTGIAPVLVVAVFFIAGAPATLLAVAGVAVAHRIARSHRRSAQVARERSLALDALSLLGADLRAGRTPAEALSAAADIATGASGAAFASAAAAARLGGDVGSALLAEGSSIQATMGALAVCWQVCSDAGSGLAAAVERLEEGMRAADTQRRSVAAELAGPRATAQLLAVLPLVGIALAAALGAHPLDLLLGTPLGLVCLGAGLALDGLGVLWTHRLVEAALP